MTWKDNKNLGPWSFKKTLADIRYNEGDSISDSSTPVFKTGDHGDPPITKQHNPCGYWFGVPVDTLILRGYDPKDPTTFGDDADGSGSTVVGPSYGPDQPEPSDPCMYADNLTIDTENSTEIISGNSSGFVYVNGGLYFMDVTISGTGFFLDPDLTIKTATISGSSFRIYTGNACGSCSIVISDGCSTVNYSVKSTTGGWATIWYSGQPPLENIPCAGMTGTALTLLPNLLTAECNGYRVTETQELSINYSYGNLLGLNGHYFGYQFDPDVHFNLSCSANTSFEKFFGTGGLSVWAPVMWAGHCFPAHIAKPHLAWSGTTSGAKFYGQVYDVGCPTGIIGPGINQQPKSYIECVYNSGSPTGPRIVMTASAQGMYWYDYTGWDTKVEQWVC